MTTYCLPFYNAAHGRLGGVLPEVTVKRVNIKPVVPRVRYPVSTRVTTSIVALDVTLQPSEEKTKSAHMAVACEVGSTTL